MKNEYGERRERLLAQVGDARTSSGVMTRLAGSRAMLMFLCDSTRVLSRPAGSGATPEMKLRLWRLYCLCTYLPLNPNWNKCVSLAWNVSIDREYGKCYTLHQASVKPRWDKNWTILLEVLDLPFTNKVNSERWISTCVLPSVVVATTTTNLTQHFVLLHQVLKI